MDDMPEEIFARETDPIYGSGEYLHQDCYQGLRNPNDTTYVRKDLTDRRDAVDALLATYERIIGPGRYPSIDREIAALEKARNG